MAMPKRLSTLLKTWFVQELWTSLKLFVPIALGYVLSYLHVTISLIYCGHYPKDTAVILEAAGLGYSITNITGFLVLFGMGTAIDTLAAQAYGAGNYKKVGVYLQQGILIQALGIMLVFAVWMNIESILNLLQQPACAIPYTASFIQGFSICLPAILFYYLLQKYLQAQGIVYPFIISEAVGIVVCAVGHYLLMFVIDLGIMGAGIAQALSQITSLATMLVIIWIRQLHKKTWGGWSWECLNGWGQYLRYSIPGLFIMIAQSCSYEVGMLVVGLTGSLQQGIYTVLFNYSFFLFMVSNALKLTAATRVGTQLGAGNPKGGKRALLVGLCISLTWVATIEVATLGFQDYIPMIYTSDPTILNAIDVHFYVVAASICCDALHSFLSGNIIGCGWQHVGAVLNVVWYWGLGAPLGVSLAIVVQLGALGYWIGQATAGFFLLCSYIVVMSTMNWKKRSEVAQKVAALHHKQDNSQKSDSSSGKDTGFSEKTSSNNSTDLKQSNNETVDQNNIKNEKVPPCPDKESNGESPHADGDSKDKVQNISQVKWKIVILRILTAVPFIVVCVGALIIGQLLVYSPTPCNTTITSNYSEYLSFDRPQSELFQTMSASLSVPLYTSPTSAVSTLNYLPEQTISTSVPLYTSPTAVVSTTNYLPEPTPTLTAATSSQLYFKG